MGRKLSDVWPFFPLVVEPTVASSESCLAGGLGGDEFRVPNKPATFSSHPRILAGPPASARALLAIAITAGISRLADGREKV